MAGFIRALDPNLLRTAQMLRAAGMMGAPGMLSAAGIPGSAEVLRAGQMLGAASQVLSAASALGAARLPAMGAVVAAPPSGTSTGLSAVGARALDPRVSQALAGLARTQERTQRFIEVVRAAMQRTGSIQVELNPCEIWTAEELVAVARMTREPLSLQLGGRDHRATLRDIRVRCPSTAMEWDYDLDWDLGSGMNRVMVRGTVTLLGEQVLQASLDPSLARPIAANICHRNFRVLRISLPQEELAARRGLNYLRRVPEDLLREANALPLCINLLGQSTLGINN